MTPTPRFREAWRFWLKLGFISFGGPAGQIAVIHRELVERRRWIGEERFLHALNFCMLLPGPEATQLATYCGWLLHGVRGGLIAGVLFVLPGAITLWVLSWVYVTVGDVPVVAAVFHGLKAAVLAIVVAAVWRVGRKALTGWLAWGLAAAAFAALFFAHVPFPVVVIAALAVGFLRGRGRGKAVAEDVRPEPVHATRSPGRQAWRTTAVILLVWFAPVVAAGLVQGWQGTFAQIGWFFSKAAVVTFGGAYAVLPYVAQQAVEQYHWLGAGQMLDGLAFAETTPGPLIIVLQFVGFMAGWNSPGGLGSLTSATIGALLTTWVTFVPTYGFILVAAPYVERLRKSQRLASALAAVTAAVVGVIFNLAVWFGWHVVRPAAGGVDGFAIVVGVLALLALQRFKIDLVPVVLASGAAGWLWSCL